LKNPPEKVDILLVGGGIMSATLATLLHLVAPQAKIQLVERLPNIALESSDAWNNAGTGHAGYCELNYTPASPSGDVNISRALSINAAFEVSLQFWAYLVAQNIIPNPKTFINPVPHISFVWGRENVEFLRQRFLKLKMHPLFKDMEFSDDVETLKSWMPLMMQQRDLKENVAATRLAYGTDVNFGALTHKMIEALQSNKNFTLTLSSEIKSLKKIESSAPQNNHWRVKILDKPTQKTKTVEAKFVFLGAGGGALKLLQKSGIAESKGYGGFPVSGQWLVCKKPEIIAEHYAKVYGKAPIGAPPMSVPHLDTRIINGKPALLFGPYAGFTTKFLKNGSYLDLIKSIKPNNLKAMLGVGRHHVDLTRYLIGEAVQKHTDRMQSLRQFYPQARDEDWHLEHAGKRVQIIKNCDEKGGKLEFGTEIVASSDGSLAALLGASPGASVSVQAMLDVMTKCFKNEMASEAWQAKLKQAIPSFGESLIENAELLKKIRQDNLQRLKLV
jgi:malate dehydrogenase (quinone)